MEYHYCVINTRAVKQWKTVKAVKMALPEGDSTVFIPCYEQWWRGTDTTVIRPLFPGYVFVRSKLGAEELHAMIKKAGRHIEAFVRELHAGRSTLTVDPGSHEDWGEFPLIDIKPDEAEFLEFILRFKYSDQKAEHKGIEADEGIIRMSKGYREGKRIVVVEGPLKGKEDHIIDVNVRQRKAYLDVGIDGHAAKAGLILMGKRYFNPGDENAPSLLADGSEIDTNAIAKKMMRLKK